MDEENFKTTNHVTIENISKCGEVYVTNCGKFLLDCYLCGTRLDQLTFFDHILNLHIKIEEIINENITPRLQEHHEKIQNENGNNNTNANYLHSLNEIETSSSQNEVEKTNTKNEFKDETLEQLDKCLKDNKNSKIKCFCDVCNFESTSKRRLIIHKKKGCGFSCKICSKILSDEKQFRLHLMEHHEKVQNENGNNNTNANYLHSLNEIETSSSQNEVEKTNTKNEFKDETLEQLDKCLKDNKNSKIKCFCEVCNFESTSKRRLIIHKKKGCGFSCKICSKILSDEKQFRLHLMEHHEKVQNENGNNNTNANYLHSLNEIETSSSQNEVEKTNTKNEFKDETLEQLDKCLKDNKNSKIKCFFCDVCNFESTSKRRLIIHKNKGCGLSCKICSKILSDEKQFHLHLKEHHEEVKNENGNNNTNAIYLRSSNKIEISSSQNEVEKTNTKNEFKDKTFEQLDKSLKDNKNSKIKSFVCDVCNFELTSKRRLSTHKKKGCGFSCKICHNILSDEKQFRLHLKDHGKIKKLFVCEICGKHFLGSSNLRVHLRQHDPSRTIYPCDKCDKKFLKEVSLENHLKLKHLNEKPYICQVESCGRRFINQKALDNHQAFHGERKFACSICNKKYLYKSKLKEHVKFYHIQGKIYHCPECEKSFYDPWTLKSHRICHSNEKPYSCDECDAKFPREKALLWHKKVHSGIKDYICKICSQAYYNYIGLYTHMKIHNIKYSKNKEKELFLNKNIE